MVFTIKIGYKIEDKAQLFLNDEVTTIEDAIEGAKDIIAERISDNPQYRSKILKDVFNQGLIVSSKKPKMRNKHFLCTMITMNQLNVLLIIVFWR